MNKPELKPCPFCGGTAVLYGQEIREFASGVWAKNSRKEYWVRAHCNVNCIYGMTAGRSLQICDGIRFRTPEAAAEAWNRRADQTDEQQVNYGKWLKTKDDNKKRCSYCNVIHLIVQYPRGEANFCPNCGAYMQEDSEPLQNAGADAKQFADQPVLMPVT